MRIVTGWRKKRQENVHTMITTEEITDIPLSLKYRIPQKIKSPSKVSSDSYNILIGICPTCGEMLEQVVHRAFCSSCGQNIDWNVIVSQEAS